MAGKPKTRFLVEMDGVSAELFSVQENADGSLMVFPHRRCEDIHHGALKEEHLSVHMSPASPGTTIKQTVRFENGSHVTYSSFVEDSKTQLLWPLFSATAPRFTKTNVTRKRARDRQVTFARYHPRSATLVYSVFVSSSGFQHSPSQSPVNLVRVAFSRFEIGVFFSFMCLPSRLTEEIQVGATSPRQIDGVPHKGEAVAQRSFELDEVEPFVVQTFAGLGNAMFFRLVQLGTPFTDDFFPIFRIGASKFVKVPPSYSPDSPEDDPMRIVLS